MNAQLPDKEAIKKPSVLSVGYSFNQIDEELVSIHLTYNW